MRHLLANLRIKYATIKPKQIVIAWALICFLSLSVLGYYASNYYHTNLLTEERQKYEKQLNSYNNTLTIRVSELFELLTSLSSFTQVSLSDQSLDTKFESFAEGLYSGNVEIRNLSIAPGGVQGYVYPFKGNEIVLGHDLIHDERPNVRTDVQRTITTRKIALSGPYELRQGGFGVVGRLAIYQGDEFWGLAAIVLDIKPLLEKVGLDPQPEDLSVAIRDSSGNVFFGEKGIFENNPILFQILLPEGYWEMGAVPNSGWGSTIQFPLFLFFSVLFLVNLLITYLVFFIVNRQRRLKLNLEQRLHAWETSESRYRDLIDHIPIGVFLSNLDGTIIDANPALIQISGYKDKNEFISSYLLDYFIDPEQIRSNQDKLRKNGFINGDEIPLLYKNGTLRWVKVYITQILGENGQLLNYQGMLEDITTQKNAEEQTKRLTRALKVRSACGQEIIRAREENLLLENICHQIINVGGYRSTWVGYAEQNEQCTVRPVAQAGFEEGYLESLNIAWSDTPDGQGPAGLSIRKSTPIIVNNVTTSTIYKDWLDDVARMGFLSSITLPLKSSHNILGVINIYASESNAFDQEEINLLQELADDLTFGIMVLRSRKELIIQQIETLEKERRRRTEYECMEQVSKAIRDSNYREELLKNLIYELKTLFQPNAEINIDFMQGRLRYSVSDIPEKFNNFRIDDYLSEVELFDILQAGSPFIKIYQITSQKDYPVSMVILPIISKNHLFGAIALFWFSHKIFSEEEQHLYYTISEMAAIALERIQVLISLEQQVTSRTRELSTLYELTAILASNENQTILLTQSLKKILSAMSASSGAIHLLNPNQTLELAVHTGFDDDSKVIVLSDKSDETYWHHVIQENDTLIRLKLQQDISSPSLMRKAGFTDYIGVPLKASNKNLGVLSILYETNQAPTLNDITLLNLVSEQMGLAIERIQLRQQSTLAAIMDERQRIARELHDSVTQTLYSLSFFADASINFAKSKKWQQVIQNLENVRSIALQSLKEMRLLVYELLPISLEKDGLVNVLQQRLKSVEQRSGVETEFITESNLNLPAAKQLGVYRIAQEALNNILKHASASEVKINIYRHNQRLVMDITDNGKGFNQSQVDGGVGLRSMHKRAEIMGGELKIISESGEGTMVRLIVDEVM